MLTLFCVGINIDAKTATFVVDSTTGAVDATPGGGVCGSSGAACTLRTAIREGNALAGADTVTVAAGTDTLTIAGTGENAAATGDLDSTVTRCPTVAFTSPDVAACICTVAATALSMNDYRRQSTSRKPAYARLPLCEKYTSGRTPTREYIYTVSSDSHRKTVLTRPAGPPPRQVH